MERRFGTIMSHLVECNTCGAEIAKSAPTCPHCGAPQGMHWLIKSLLLALAGGGILALYVFLFRGPRLPSCDSSTAASEVAEAMEGAPMGRVLGLRLIKITDPKEVSATEKERRCRGRAMLSNAQAYTIDYKFYIDAQNDVMVEAKVRGLLGF